MPAPLMLSPHFALAEFVATQHRGIDNTLPGALYEPARETCAMLERIREFLQRRSGLADVPIRLSSGYRCPALNTAVGSSPSSDHPRAMAADWTAPAFGAPYDIARALEPMAGALGIGQLIAEFCTAAGGGWVHTSTRRPTNPANAVITIDRSGVRSGICRPAA